MHGFSLKHLSDEALTHALESALGRERHALALLLAHIAEFDARELYLPAGCASMYRYCVDRLQLSEDAAAKRIQVARLARAFPLVFAAVAEGRLHLSGLSLLAPRITPANGHELLAAAMSLSRAGVELLLAERFPAVTHSETAPVLGGASGEPATAAPNASGEVAPDLVSPIDQIEEPVPVPGRVLVPGPAAIPAPHARVRPIAPGRFELVAVLDRQTHDQLLRSRELLAHAVPSGSLAEVLERAIALQFARLQKRRCGASARPRTRPPAVSSASCGEGGVPGREPAARPVAAPAAPVDPRHIPAAVLRAVWERDGGRCTFEGADGHRCGERGRLEVDHVVPVARGGRATVENLRLLCRAHNRFTAERELGRQHVRARREAAQRARSEERRRRQAERERAARRRQEIERQRDELGEAFRQLGYRGADLERALAHCASRPEAPLEERLKHALGCMAPRALKQSPAPNDQAPPASTAAA